MRQESTRAGETTAAGGRTSLLDNEGFCKLIIIAAALFWGVSFVFMQGVTMALSVFWTLAIRFAIASAFCAVMLWRRFAAGVDRRTVVAGLVMGVFFWLGYVFQTTGLLYTTPGKNAFLTACYCVIVPFCAWLMGMGKPARNNVVGAVVALVGLALVAVDNGLPVNRGDVLTLVCAVFFALQMAYTSKSGGGSDIWVATTIEFATVAVLSLPVAIVHDPAPTLETFTPQVTGAMLFLAIGCSALATLFYNHAFTKVDPTAGSLFSALESPFGVAFSVLMTHEALTGRVLLGFALIFVGIVISEVGARLVVRFRGGERTVARE